MKPCHVSLFIGSCLLAIAQNCAAQSTMVPWVTRSADNARSGWNPHETQLTQASVETKGISRATIVPLFGDARGMEAQPLILPNVKLPNGTTRDVMVLPSMANVVRGVDPHTGEGLWSVTLGVPIDGNTPTGPRKVKPDGCVAGLTTSGAAFPRE
jgi:hypothetical protein